MDWTAFFEKARAHYESGRPFVVYRKPSANSIQGYFQSRDLVFTLSKEQTEGFVFADFVGDRQLLIPTKEAEVCSIPMEGSKPYRTDTSVSDHRLTRDKEAHLRLVNQGISFISGSPSISTPLPCLEGLYMKIFSETNCP